MHFSPGGGKIIQVFADDSTFFNREMLPHDVAVNHVFSKYASVPDDVCHADAVAVYDILQNTIRDSPDPRLMDESLYESSGCLYLL